MLVLRFWVLPLAQALPKQMDFDRRLEIELAHLLDRVVRTPVPPRRGHPVNRPAVKLSSSAGMPPTASGVSEPPGVKDPARYF